MVARTARVNSHGIDWELALERYDLLPGTTARGTVALRASGATSGRGVIAALIATEQWQFEQSSTDAQGRVSSHTETRTEELRRMPVQLVTEVTFAAGQRRDFAFEVPVPPLGPATLEATVSRLTWELEIKLDRPAEMDSAVVIPVVVLQPTALLRAGVVHVGAFALYEAADSATNEAKATVEIKPMPICVGAPIDGRLTIDTVGSLDLQEIRLEIRVKVEATVSSGRHEELTLWAARLMGPGRFGGTTQVLPFRADIPATHLPTIQLPHGRAEATFHVILAEAWARDPHLVRDVAICSTTEL